MIADNVEINIYDTFRRLCQSILYEGEHQSERNFDLDKIRQVVIKCYAVIVQNSQYPVCGEWPQSTIDKLSLHNFAKSCEVRNNDYHSTTSDTDYVKLEHCIESIRDDSSFNNGLGECALKFLMSLRDCKSEEEAVISLNKSVNIDKSTYICDFELKDKIYDDILHRCLFKNYPKLPFPVEREYNDFEKSVFFPRNGVRTEKPCTKFNTKFFTINNPQFDSGRADLNSRKRYGWNWEHLGKQYVPIEPTFISDVQSLLPYQHFQKSFIGEIFSPKILPLNRFLLYLKFLTIGIGSEIFFLDDLWRFYMKPKVTIPNLLPDVLDLIIKDFLECGSCCCRLQLMINYGLNECQFTFMALCNAVDKYLANFRLYVTFYEDDSILEYYARIKNMMRLLSSLSQVLGTHPIVSADSHNFKLPFGGSQLLGYLHKEIMHAVKEDLIMLLVYIFKCCCHAYFVYLQKWIFHGIIDEPSTEFFISYAGIYRQNTKYFFDKAYTVRKDLVPQFLQGCEDQILQCGKYTMLLKTFKPAHPIFRIEYPSISVCLFFDDICKLKENCNAYTEKVRVICGESISVREIFQQRIESKRSFLKMAAEKSSQSLARLKMEQQNILEQQAIEKAERFAELQQRLQEETDIRMEKRKEKFECEMQLVEEVHEAENETLIKENQELESRISYYQELNLIVNEQRNRLCDTTFSGSEYYNSPESKSTESISNETLSNKEILSTSSEYFTDVASSNNNTQSVKSNDYEYSPCKFIQNAENNNYVDCEDLEENPLVPLTPKELIDEFVRIRNEIFDSFSTINMPQIKSSGEIDNNAQKDEQYPEIPQDDKQRNGNTSKTCFGAKSELEINREKMMYGDTFAVINKTPERKKLYLDWNTERGRNRQKVMESEFHMTADSVTVDTAVTPMSTTSDYSVTSEEKDTEDANDIISDEVSNICHIASNIMIARSKTECQQNRERMMGSDPFFVINKEPKINNFYANDVTERAQNRRKVMESEFDMYPIIRSRVNTIEPKKSSTISSEISTLCTENFNEQFLDIESVDTTPASEEKSSEIDSIAPIQVKSNIDSERLKINVEIAQDFSEDIIANLTTSIPETPLSALNTAGLLLRNGFQFDNYNTNKNENDILLDLKNNDAQIFDFDTIFGVGDDDDNGNNLKPFKKYQNEIENRPLTSFFAFQKLSEKEQRQELETELEKIGNEFSVISLTDFIQKSVVIPLKAHLNVMNNEILRIYFKDLSILEHFRALRSYFFLMDGEFGSHICDSVIDQLECGAQPNELLNYHMLHIILRSAIGYSSSTDDKYSEKLSFIVNDIPAKFDLHSPSVLSNLTLCYSVDWPLNLILNAETLEQYSSIFKYLIKVRRISWVLEQSYQKLKETVKKNGKDMLLSPQYRHVQQIRHKFYHFVLSLQHHITSCALQASWKTFKDDLISVQSMEDLYRKHATYIKKIRFLCLLNRHSVEFYTAVDNVFKVTLKFYYNLKSREWKRKQGAEFYTHSRYERILNDENEFEECIKYIIYLGNKIVRHGYQKEVGDFVNLINFNRYYVDDSQNACM